MKVWAVFKDYEYDGLHLLGIYSTKEKAEEIAQRQKEVNDMWNYPIQEHEIDALPPELQS